MNFHPDGPVSDDPVKILLLEDSPIDAELLESHLRRSSLRFTITWAANRADYMAAVEGRQVDIVLADYSLPDFDGLTALSVAREQLPDVPFLFVSGVVGEEFATDALKQGATDYVLKRNLLRLPAALERAMAEAQERRKRHQAEAALRESEIRMRLAVSAARISTWDYDPATRSVVWIRRDENGTRQLQTDMETSLAKVHPDDRPGLEQAISLAMRDPGTGTLHYEYRLREADDDERWVMVSGQGFFHSGQCTRLLGITQDVTDRRAAESALQQLNKVLARQLLDRTRERDRMWQLSRDLLMVCDLQGQALVLNQAWTDMLGWPHDLLREHPVFAIVHPDDRVELARLTGTRQGPDQEGDDHQTLRIESRLRRQDGAYRWIAWTAVRDQDLVYAIGRDITEEKLAAEELAATNRQLVMQIDERSRMEATLQQMQRLEAVGQLTSGVAHDFNNLLTVILGNLTFLQRDLASLATPPAAERRMGQITKAAERGAQLTSQLLAFSRRQRLAPKPVDLNETVAGMRDLLRSTIGGSVQLRMVLHAAPWNALVDPTQIELIILNLAINARDAMAVGGSLTVTTDNVTLTDPPKQPEEPGPGKYVMLAVTDTGSGMTEEVLAKAFEPFFTTKDVGKGSGLGLAQVYGFAKQSGGGVALETKLGAGTTVKVYLPRATVAPDQAGQTDAPDCAMGAAPTRHVVLLVDDDGAVREVTSIMLQELGYEVLEASNGRAALDILARDPRIKLAVLDYAMPGMNGAEVAVEIAKRRPDLPSLFITGYADLGALRQVAEGRIVQKPFRASDLAAKVRSLLRGPYGQVA